MSETNGLSLRIQNDPLAISALLDDLVAQREQALAWNLKTFRVAQKHFGDDAYRVDSDGFAAWLDEQITALKASASSPLPPSLKAQS